MVAVTVTVVAWVAAVASGSMKVVMATEAVMVMEAAGFSSTKILHLAQQPVWTTRRHTGAARRAFSV